MSERPLPLAGIRVVDFTHVLAGPACAYYLGLLGADVIKVESIERGDAMRHRGGTDRARADDQMSTAYLTQGAGKRSIAVDLEHEKGTVIFNRLLERADVLVENHVPATAEAFGLGADALLERFPRLIHCAMTGYGRGGPLSGAPAYDVNIQAFCGIMTMTGAQEAGPTRTGAPIMDYGTALAAGFAVMTALFERERTGAGSVIDVSMLDTAFALMSSTAIDYALTGHAPKQRGNAANSRSPSAGSFQCLDGLLSLGVNEQSQFEALAKVCSTPQWCRDPRFRDVASRRDHAAALRALIADVLATRSAADWEADMLAAGVPAARVRTLPDALGEAHVAARGFLLPAEGSSEPAPTLPFRPMGGSAYRASGPAPRLGADTRAVLAELGYADSEIDDFLVCGAVQSAEQQAPANAR